MSVLSSDEHGDAVSGRHWADRTPAVHVEAVGVNPSAIARSGTGSSELALLRRGERSELAVGEIVCLLPGLYTLRLEKEGQELSLIHI